MGQKTTNVDEQSESVSDEPRLEGNCSSFREVFAVGNATRLECKDISNGVVATLMFFAFFRIAFKQDVFDKPCNTGKKVTLFFLTQVVVESLGGRRSFSFFSVAFS